MSGSRRVLLRQPASRAQPTGRVPSQAAGLIRAAAPRDRPHSARCVQGSQPASSIPPAEVLQIRGGTRLQGRVDISGSKNAALVLMAASLLCRGPVVLHRMPNLTDIHSMAAVMKSTGASVSNRDRGTMEIDGSQLSSVCPSAAATQALRAGFLVFGPLLARHGEAVVAFPGGCKIGARPVDLHVYGLERMGASVTQHGDVLSAAGKLHGADIHLRFPSVGATECLIMAASIANGTTVIRNAAMEPEVVALAEFLNLVGARVSGAGSPTVRIEGVKELSGGTCDVVADRIEAGTFAAAAACLPGSELLLAPVVPAHMAATVDVLKAVGCSVDILSSQTAMRVISPPEGSGLRPTSIHTQPFPGFPTDLQPQLTSVLTFARGVSNIQETVFEGRLRHAGELRRMGASIDEADGSSLRITGRDGCGLEGAEVTATDLRCGAALVIAGLAARGLTTIHEPWHIDRGYDCLDGKLKAVGAELWRSQLPPLHEQ